MSNAADRLKAMLAELQAHPDIEVTESFVGEPATTAQLRQGRRWMRLPTSLLELYKVMNGFTVRWRYTGDNEGAVVAGNIRLLPIEHMADDWTGIVWFPEVLAPLAFLLRYVGFSYLRCWRMLPFDFFTEESCCAFKMRTLSRHNVYLVHTGEDNHALRMSWTGYFEKLLACRGFSSWQNALLAERWDAADTEGPAGQLRRFAPQLFPDFDAANFFSRSYADDDRAFFDELEVERRRYHEALDAHGVSYETIPAWGEVAIRLSADLSNLHAAEAAFEALGEPESFVEDGRPAFASTQYGRVHIHLGHPQPPDWGD